MDFIERLFGVSPDNGDGSTELMWFIAFVAVALVLTRRWWLRRAVARRSGVRPPLPPREDRQ
jgi:hypothetical protein